MAPPNKDFKVQGDPYRNSYPPPAKFYVLSKGPKAGSLAPPLPWLTRTTRQANQVGPLSKWGWRVSAA